MLFEILIFSTFDYNCPALLAPSLCSSTKKTSGSEVRRTPVVKSRFVGFIRFVGFNFGHVQLLKFIVVMVWSYSFGHLDLVKGITLCFDDIK